MLRSTLALVTLSVTLSATSALANPMQDQMLRELDAIGAIIQSQYAPQAWKNRHFGWDLNKELDAVKTAIKNNPNVKSKDFRLAVAQLLDSTRDYHVGFQFYKTERATLPFAVKSVNGKYYIVSVDPAKTKLVKSGDELIEFDGKPVGEVVESLKNLRDPNTAETEQSLAELMLTRRSAGRGAVVPNDSVLLKIKNNEGRTVERQVLWDYQAELVDDVLAAKTPQPLSDMEKIVARLSAVKMLSSVAYLADEKSSPEAPEAAGGVNPKLAWEDPFAIGGRSGFVPDLGKSLWVNAGSVEQPAIFRAALYDVEGKKVGFLRLPSYVPEDAMSAVVEFEEIVTKFQKEADMMVIDQTNNPGGSVFYLYALVSKLTDSAIKTPRHRLALNPTGVVEALQLEGQIQTMLAAPSIPEGSNVEGYPMDRQFLLFIQRYTQHIQSEWKKGKTLSDPTHLYGVDMINPTSEVPYTKPLLLLTNELDFSGGDFFPAILQDAKRVTIMGTRTAGAGGFVGQFTFPSLFGLAAFTLTGSLAERVDNNPIENLGVVPDINYGLSVNDLQNGFVDYKNKVLETVNQMLAQ